MRKLRKVQRQGEVKVDTCIIVSVSFLIAESKHLSRRNLGRLRFEGKPMVAGSEGSSSPWWQELLAQISESQKRR